MYKSIITAYLCLSSTVFASTSLAINDNSDIALTLSHNNYNRLVIKNDKIIEAVFPENAMIIKRDEHDGSAYLMLLNQNPFTLFVTTEAGHHFSVTLNSEEGLGKTFELIPQTVITKPKIPGLSENKAIVATKHDVVPEAILAMLTHMEQHKPFVDVKIEHLHGKAERWSKGLSLLPKENWRSAHLSGDVMEFYNGSTKPLTLSESWFIKKGTLAVKFSKPTLAPHEHAMIYRVKEVDHG